MKDISAVSQKVISCTRCPRLTKYRSDVAAKKVRRFLDWDYWGRPVPGFGDENARVLVIGLAPAAHGANRTGRMFTGDSSGDWLYRALYETGFANQPHSVNGDDGLQLTGIFISAVCRCAPPDNKPLPSEIQNCSAFLEEEIEILQKVKVILCLGQISFKHYCKLHSLRGLQFLHGKRYRLDNERSLISSYHPSRQNTNTGRLRWDDWMKVFQNVRSLIG